MRKNDKKQKPVNLRLISLIALLLVFSLLISAFTANKDAGSEDAVVNDVIEKAVEIEVVQEDDPDQPEYYAVPHNVYDLGKGPNTACSGCHSPFNWDPDATFGPPPSCWTCKFAFDAEVRIAENNPLVEEADWEGIPCKTCHEVDENGTASAEYAWFNQFTGEYDAVSNSTELCEKCHVTTTGNAWGSGVDHKITLGGSAHLNYSRFTGGVTPPQYCADCHDPHDNKSTPSCEDCHAGVKRLTTHAYGKSGFHARVTCLACHNSSGLDVGPVNGLWTTTVTTAGRGGPSTEVVASHSPTHEVLCTKCHFEGNPNGLTERTDVGGIPEVVICQLASETEACEDCPPSVTEDTTMSVAKPSLGDYGEVDVDYTLGECPEEEPTDG